MSLRNTSYFNPTLISGCTLWLDGADSSTLTLSSGVVTQWNDKSGSGRNTTTIGGSPTFSSNFINLNGSSTYLVGPYINTTEYLTMFVIATADFSQGVYAYYYRLLSVGSTSANDYNSPSYASILHNPNSTQIGGYRNFATNFGSVTTNTTFLICLQYDGTNSTNFINGTSASSVASTGSFGTTSYSIGRDVGNTDGGGAYTYWPGKVGEVIIFNSSLSNTQRQQVEGYLAWKWGLASSLPSSHPHALSPSFGLPSLVPNAPAKTRVTYANHPVIAAGGCALWLDAADSSTISYSSGSNLSQWRDKSGNGYIMTNNTGTTTVASAELNSYNAIYTPSGTSAKIASFTGRTKFTLFFVGKCAAGKYLLGFNSGFVYAGNDTLMSFTVSGNTFDCVDSIGLTNSVVSANTWFIFSIGYDNVAAFTPNPYNINGSPLNGANRTTITSPYITPSIVTDQYVSNPFYINSLGTNSYDSDYTAEIIFYNTNLNVSQRWGLTANLPVGHPFKSSFPLFPSPVTGVRRIAGRRWSPLTPGNCVLWLDGADSSTFTLSSTSVTQWRDKSGNSNHMANNGISPIYNASLINSLGGIDCTNGGALISSGFQNSANLSFAMVAVVKSGLGFWGSFFTHGGRDTDFAVERNSIVGTTIHFQTANDNSQCGIAYTVDAPVLYFGTMTSGTSRFFESFSGGTNTITTGTNSSSISLGSQIARVGKSDNNEVCNSFISEIIYYTAVLGTTQRQEIEGYLAWKWGLKASLPSSHPYKLFPPSP
jgi:hypothetical protein